MFASFGGIVSKEIGSNLRELAASRIYFGHHSVGDNMLSGLELIAAEEGVSGIHVVDLDSTSDPELPGAFFAHSRVGRNMDPKSKVDDFARRLRGGLPAKPDLAFMKFCYVDLDPNSDVPEIFDYYRSTLDRLGAEFPDVRLPHATIPLMTRQLGLKNRIKLLLGRDLWRDEANIKRWEFNDLLRRTHDESRIIDVARAESTNADGTRERFAKAGKEYYSLSPAYTDDGGHLNETGQRRVAAEMLRVLAGALQEQSE